MTRAFAAGGGQLELMNSSGFGTIIQIGDVLVSEDVVCEFFACDYAACGGACCVEGESGAPLEESELDSLEEGYEAYSGLMSDAGRSRVAEVGFFEVDRDGDLVTPCVALDGGSEAGASGEAASGLASASGACAFCHFGGGTLCAIEMAGREKPVSCALYPIRITKMPGGGLALNLHRWDICRAAFEKGRREGVRAYEFLRGPLERRFGAEFYEALSAAAQHILSEES